MKGFIYLLKSEKDPNKYYLGSTCDPAKRIKHHCGGFTHSTKSLRPLKCELLINVGLIESARIIERYIKNQKEKLCVENVIKSLNRYYKNKCK